MAIEPTARTQRRLAVGICRVRARFQSDPASQHLNLAVEDWQGRKGTAGQRWSEVLSRPQAAVRRRRSIRWIAGVHRASRTGKTQSLALRWRWRTHPKKVPAKNAQTDMTRSPSMKPPQENDAGRRSGEKFMPWNRLFMNPGKGPGAASQTRVHRA